MRDEVALIDTRLSEVLARIQTGESPNAWLLLGGLVQELAEQVRAFEDAEEPDDVVEQIAQTGERIGDVVRRALSEESAWEHARLLINQRMKLVESERKRLVDLQQVMTSEQVLVLAGALVASVRQHVADPRVLGAISADVDRLLSRSDQGRTLAGAALAAGA